MSIAAGTLGYQRGLTASQVAKLSPEEKMEYMKFITELRKTIEQLKMETVESYAQVAGIEAQVLAEVTSAYLQARAQGDDARATALSGLSSSLTERIRQMSDPDPAFQKKIEKDGQLLTEQAFNTASNIANNSENISPQQLVDTYLNEIKAGNKKELGNLQIAQIRNKAAAQNALPGTGAATRGLTMMTGRSVIEKSIERGLITAGLNAGLDPDLVADAYLQKQEEFRNYIGLEPKKEDIGEVEVWAQRNIDDIKQIQKDLKSAGTSLDALDYYVSVVKPGNLGELIAGGPSKLTEELKDEVVAPETAKFIKDLQAELQASVEAKDVFDRAIDAYSKIPGANQLRTALGLGDDYKFSYYVSRNPGAFNEVLKGVNKAADDADRDVNKLSSAEMRGLVARSLASDRRESPEAQDRMARRLANRPGRMRRLMRRQAGKADRDLAKEVAASGLSQEPDVEDGGARAGVRTTPPAAEPTPTETSQSQADARARAQAAAQEQDSGVVPELDQESQPAVPELDEESEQPKEALAAQERARITGEERARLKKVAEEQLKADQAQIASQFGEEDKVMIGQNPFNRFVKAYQELGYPVALTDISQNRIIPAPDGKLYEYNAVVNTPRGQIFIDSRGNAVANYSSVTPLTEKDLPDPPRSTATSRQQLPGIDYQDQSRVETPTSSTPASDTGASAAQTTSGTKVRTNEVEITEDQPTDTPAGEPPAEGPSLGGQQNTEAKMRKPKLNRNSMLAMRFSDTPVNYG